MLESLSKIKNINEKEGTKGEIVSKIIQWLDVPAYQTPNLLQRGRVKEIKSSRLTPVYLANKEGQKAAFENNLSN